MLKHSASKPIGLLVVVTLVLGLVATWIGWRPGAHVTSAVERESASSTQRERNGTAPLTVDAFETAEASSRAPVESATRNREDTDFVEAQGMDGWVWTAQRAHAKGPAVDVYWTCACGRFVEHEGSMAAHVAHGSTWQVGADRFESTSTDGHRVVELEPSWKVNLWVKPGVQPPVVRAFVEGASGPAWTLEPIGEWTVDGRGRGERKDWAHAQYGVLPGELLHVQWGETEQIFKTHHDSYDIYLTRPTNSGSWVFVDESSREPLPGLEIDAAEQGYTTDRNGRIEGLPVGRGMRIKLALLKSLADLRLVGGGALPPFDVVSDPLPIFLDLQSDSWNGLDVEVGLDPGTVVRMVATADDPKLLNTTTLIQSERLSDDGWRIMYPTSYAQFENGVRDFHPRFPTQSKPTVTRRDIDNVVYFDVRYPDETWPFRITLRPHGAQHLQIDLGELGLNSGLREVQVHLESLKGLRRVFLVDAFGDPLPWTGSERDQVGVSLGSLTKGRGDLSVVAEPRNVVFVFGTRGVNLPKVAVVAAKENQVSEWDADAHVPEWSHTLSTGRLVFDEGDRQVLIGLIALRDDGLAIGLDEQSRGRLVLPTGAYVIARRGEESALLERDSSTVVGFSAAAEGLPHLELTHGAEHKVADLAPATITIPLELRR